MEAAPRPRQKETSEEYKTSPIVDSLTLRSSRAAHSVVVQHTIQSEQCDEVNPENVECSSVYPSTDKRAARYRSKVESGELLGCFEFSRSTSDMLDAV